MSPLSLVLQVRDLSADLIGQRTVDKIASLKLLPAKEFPFDDAAVARFRDRWHHAFNVDVRRCSVYQDVSSYIVPNGVEYYLPFFFDELGTLFDYLPGNVLLVVEHGAMEAAQHHLDETLARYESLRHDIERPILPVADLYLAIDELYGKLKQHPRIELSPDQAGKHDQAFASAALPSLELNARAATPAEKLIAFIEAQSVPVLFAAESAGRREVFDELLRKAGIQTHLVDDFAGYRDDMVESARHCITVADLDEGVHLDSCIVITETDVLGTRQSDPRRESRECRI